MGRYSYSACLSFGTDGEADYCEMDVTISYAVRPGCPEMPPSYSHGGLPAEPAEIDDIRVEMIDGRAVVAGDAITCDAILGIFESGIHDPDLMTEAGEIDADLREQAADARREARQ